MKVIFRFLITAMSLASHVFSGPAAAELPDDRQRTLDHFVGQFAEFAMFDGTVLVDIAGDTVYRQSFGYAQAEFGLRHSADTRFRIASVSKMFTDVAFARLVDGGKLNAEDPLAKFLPEFPRAEDITIGQLLKHTAGIPHSNEQPWGKGAESMTVDEIVARLAALPLDFEPGSDRSYSNGGYAVAAKVLEVVTGKPFAGALRELVLDPLDLDNTNHIDNVRHVIWQMATGYTPGPIPASRAQARFYAVETRPGGGSMYSSAEDMLRFARAIFREDFLSDESRRDIVGVDEDGLLSQGRSPGFVTKLLYRPDSDTIVLSLSNNYAVPAGWAATIADIASGVADQDPWPTLRRGNHTVEANDSRIGRYRSSFGGFEVDIRRSAAGHLISDDIDNGGTVALIPLADGAYLQPQYFQRCEQDPGNKVITCRMLSGDPRYTSMLTPTRQ